MRKSHRETRWETRDQEVPDPTPIELPGGIEKPPTLRELVAQYVRDFGQVMHTTHGAGTEEEENDFELDDDDDVDLASPHELRFQEMKDDHPDAVEPAAPAAAPAQPQESDADHARRMMSSDDWNIVRRLAQAAGYMPAELTPASDGSEPGNSDNT